MILAIDIGNSSTKAAVFEGASPIRVLSLGEAGADTLAEALGGLEITRAGIASVVPSRTGPITDAVRAVTGCDPLIVQPGIRLPFDMMYETPSTLGADRLAAAAGAVALFPDADPLVVIDAGTAVTLEVVARGAFLGGAIAPGPDLVRRALATGTAQLPKVAAVLPSSPIGRSTGGALQAGVMVGFVGVVRELLARTTAELAASPRVVVTGGWATFLAEQLPEIDHLEPHLVLHGIRALVERSAST